MLHNFANRRVLAAVLMFCGLASLAVLATPRAQLPSPALGTNFPMYISKFDENAIYKIDSTGHQELLTSGLNFPISYYESGFELGRLAVDRDGNVYTNVFTPDGSGHHQIVKIDALGNQSIFATQGPDSLLGRTHAMAFDPSGNLMVSNQVASDLNILRIAPDGTQNVYAAVDFESYGVIKTLAFDDSGLLYGIGWLSDGVTPNRIWKIPAGGPLVAYSSGAFPDRKPYAMAFGAWPHIGLNPGTLLMSEVDYDFGWLTSLDGTGVTGTFSGAGMPTAFAFGPGSDLYLAMNTVEDGPGLYKGDSLGNLTLFSDLADLPGAIAFTPDAASYAFSGFDRPVDAPPAVNPGKAGHAVPLKWQLTDQAGEVVSSLDAIASITYQTADCNDIDGTTSAAIPAQAKGQSGLRYDATTNQFSYNWASPATPGCYKLSLTLDTGQVFTAQFKLTK